MALTGCVRVPLRRPGQAIIRAFTSAEFGQSVIYTVFFTVVSAIIGQNVLGMALALLMRKGNAVVRALVSAW